MEDLNSRVAALEKAVAGLKSKHETKPCTCGKLMVRVQTGQALMTYPARYRMMWWCKCGRTFDAGEVVPKTSLEVLEEIWLEANQDSEV
jgi:hypothetical protein